MFWVVEQWKFVRKKTAEKFCQEAFKAAEKNPILIDKFIDNAMEVDVDALSDGKKFTLQV